MALVTMLRALKFLQNNLKKGLTNLSIRDIIKTMKER